MGNPKLLSPNRTYGTWEAYHPEIPNYLMFRCNNKKAESYIRRGLGRVIDSNKFQLTFIPKGIGDRILLDKKHMCVVTGETKNLTRHHVVPLVYVKLFDKKTKRGNSYDVLMLRQDIHQDYEKSVLTLTRQLAREAGVEFMSDELKNAKICANTLINIGTDLECYTSDYINHCWETVNSYRKKYSEIYSLKDIVDKYYTIKTQDVYAKIFSKVKDVTKFQEMWRSHFVNTLRPQYLPTYLDASVLNSTAKTWSVVKPESEWSIDDIQEILKMREDSKDFEIVPNINVAKAFEDFCEDRMVDFQLDNKVNPYDDSTLFCPAGMQQFKAAFKNPNYTGTLANIQSCIRMNDFDEIGDGTHLLYFNMMGLFSFRELSLKDAVDFWMDFLETIGLQKRLSYVTVHPDKIEEWQYLYKDYTVEVRPSEDCIWSDGEIGGYCTEFFIDDVEIGNIVNPLGDCIDVGFGLERLDMFVNNISINRFDTLVDSIHKIINSGYRPSNLKQGYVLRKLLRELYKCGGSIEHEYFQDEINRQGKIVERYSKLKDKHQDKPKEWWYDTHGINIDEMEGI